MHFMNPVPVMKLVEVIRALQTSDETHKTTEEYMMRYVDWQPRWVRKLRHLRTLRASLPTDCSCLTSTKLFMLCMKALELSKTSTRL